MRLAAYLKTCNEVYHTTFDPKVSGVCRIHLVPPKKPRPWTPWAVIINGYSLLPLQSSWAVLLKIFIEHLNHYANKVLTPGDIGALIQETTAEAHKIFPSVDPRVFAEDLDEMVTTFKDLAMGKEPSAKLGYMTLGKYAKHMKAPHRMDLMVSAMSKEGHWACNQQCAFCYAAEEPMSAKKELGTEEWEKIIDKLKEIGIPSLTFTGGEATLWDDLPELVKHASWFVTRLNSNGIRLTPELCQALYAADLDSVQITLYSSNPAIHNLLVGGPHFAETVQGIKNALAAGLDVSVNTPLSSLNKDYLSTVKFLEGLGVHYLSCSGLIPTGNALNEASKASRLSFEEITAIVNQAHAYAHSKEMEVSFTSPGWIKEEVLTKQQMVVPSCGACLSNMAIAPDGEVLPCQSWLGGLSLGNILEEKWEQIWNGKACKAIRKRAAKEEQICLLKEEESAHE
jgi:MoaA/NifB/PqqE/SkfB family radical SAM enzyme